jgi:hypothetical protein
MTDHNPPAELPAKDWLLTRPDEEPLPVVQDLKATRKDGPDPKPAPPGGQGTDPKAREIDYTA